MNEDQDRIDEAIYAEERRAEAHEVMTVTAGGFIGLGLLLVACSGWFTLLCFAFAAVTIIRGPRENA